MGSPIQLFIKMILGIGISPIPGEINGMTTLINPAFYDSIGQGTWIIGVDSIVQWNAVWRNSSLADGDNISYKVYLTAGTYTFYSLFKTYSGAAIMDIDIDGVEVASFDGYSAGIVANVLFSQPNIVVAESGVKTVRLRVDGRHASSTGWSLNLINFQFARTA